MNVKTPFDKKTIRQGSPNEKIVIEKSPEPKSLIRNHTENKSLIEDPTDYKIMKKKQNNEHLRSQKLLNKNDLEKTKKLALMIKDLQNFQKEKKSRFFSNLKELIAKEKISQKMNAASLIVELLDISKGNMQKNFLTTALEKLKKNQKISKNLQNKIFFSKKQALRSRPHEKITKIPLILLSEKLEFLNLIGLRLKLGTFESIVQKGFTVRPEHKFGLRTLFRVLEAKKLIKKYHTFYDIQKSTKKRSYSNAAKSVQFFRKLNKIITRSSYSTKSQIFKFLKSNLTKTKAASKLFKLLAQIKNSKKSKNFIFSLIKLYSDRVKVKSMVKYNNACLLLKRVYIRRLAFAFV